MKITGIEAIVLVWPAPEKDYWTSLRTIGRVNELIVRVHTDTNIVGIGEAHSSVPRFPEYLNTTVKVIYSRRDQLVSLRK